MYCCKCQKEVNVITKSVPFIWAYIINYDCEECGQFISSDIENMNKEEQADFNKYNKNIDEILKRIGDITE